MGFTVCPPLHLHPLSDTYGEECQQKYVSASAWKAQIVDGEVLCVHGGLSPDIRTLDQIRVLWQAQETPHEGTFCDLMSDVKNWAVSPSGAGWLFGGSVSREVRTNLGFLSL